MSKEITKKSIRIVVEGQKRTRDILLSKTIPDLSMNKPALMVATRWVELLNLEIENLEFILENC